MIELLVGMFLSVGVIIVGSFGLVQAFKQNTQISDRVYTASSSEVGLQVLVQDLRYAVNGSCGTSGAVSGVDIGAPQSGVETISMCRADGTLSGTSGSPASYAAASEPIVWTCNTNTTTYTPSSGSAVLPETCARTINGSGSVSFHGITSLTLTGIVNGTEATLSANSYTLNSGSTLSLSWVGISGALSDLENPLNRTDLRTVPDTVSIPFQTGAALRNYAT